MAAPHSSHSTANADGNRAPALRAAVPRLAAALRARRRQLRLELEEVPLDGAAAETERDPVAERLAPLLLDPVPLRLPLLRHDANLARRQRVERDREGDREPPVDRALVVGREIEAVRVAHAHPAREVAEMPLALVDREVEEDRDEIAVGGRSRSLAGRRPRGRSAPARSRAPGPPRRRSATSSGRGTCRTPSRGRRWSRPRRRHVVPAVELEHGARLDPEELRRFVLVREEAEMSSLMASLRCRTKATGSPFAEMR